MQFSRVVCGTKAKHALWFAAAIGNMEHSQHGKVGSPTSRQCRDVHTTRISVPLRWVKASSECIVCDTEVCKGIAIIRGRFVTIYGD